MVPGFDISKWQVFLSYALARLFLMFCYMKHSTGVWKDTRFFEHLLNIKQHFELYGAYHWLYPNKNGNDILTALRAFALETKDFPLPSVLDVEDKALTRADVALAIQIWMQVFPYPPIIYTRPDIWNKIGVPLPPGSVIWIASYPRNCLGFGPLTRLTAMDNIVGKVAAWLLQNTLPKVGGLEPVLWQFDDRAIAPTFGTDPYQSKSLDLNVFFGTYEELKNLKETMMGNIPNEPEPSYRVRTLNQMNLRISPAGAIAGRMIGGAEKDIFAIVTATLNGVNYTWGQRSDSLWMAIGRNGDLAMVDVLKDYSIKSIYVAVTTTDIPEGMAGGACQVLAASEEEAAVAAKVHQASLYGVEPDDVDIMELFGPFNEA